MIDAAVGSARAALGLAVSEPATAWPVADMRPNTSDYVLVVFGLPGAATAIAAVDPVTREVLESARMPGRAPHALITNDEAVAHAGIGTDARARLVWQPSAASRSRFYPLWEVRAGERAVWVDGVRGVVWKTLDAGRGGGSAGS